MVGRVDEGSLSGVRSKHGGANVRFPPPLVFLGLMGGAEVAFRWGWPLAVPLAAWPRVIVGVSLGLAGISMVLAAHRWFRRTGQNPAPWRPSPELVLQGIYRYTRNPMYIGMSLLQVGIGIARGNGWIAALAPMALAIVHVIAVRPEEAYLTETFGESYARYTATVRRYFW